jgi:hypothetical protein
MNIENIEKQLNEAVTALNEKINSISNEAALRFKCIQVAEDTFKDTDGNYGVRTGDIDVFLSYADRIYKYITEGTINEEA